MVHIAELPFYGSAPEWSGVNTICSSNEICYYRIYPACLEPIAQMGPEGHHDWDHQQGTAKEATMEYEDLLARVTVNPAICAGKPCIRGTRIYIAVILDALAEGLTSEQIIEHYPQLMVDDIRAALAYAAELSRENVWKVAAGE
jgi:uncharacterized protein (DUF433 family)